jgi:hypothetical protein
MMTVRQRRQREAAAPRDADLIEQLDVLQIKLTEALQSRNYLRKTARRVADEIGKRGLVDLADDLRLAARNS